jgi:hypothetical protein
MTRAEILDAAKEIICKDREGQYGAPENNFALISVLWKAYIRGAIGQEIDLRAEDVANLMALLKIARIATGEPKADNYIDLAGYAACAGELATK